MAKPLHLLNGLPTEVPATAASMGSADAGKLPELGADGRLDSSLLPPGIGADTKNFPATEALSAGDFVNIYPSSGIASVRKADASATGAGKRAHGFVLTGVASGGVATVYFEGPNAQLSDLAPGTTYVLSHTTPGGVLALSAGTTTAGQILQKLGVATSNTEINIEIGDPIVRG